MVNKLLTYLLTYVLKHNCFTHSYPRYFTYQNTTVSRTRVHAISCTKKRLFHVLVSTLFHVPKQNCFTHSCPRYFTYKNCFTYSCQHYFTNQNTIVARVLVYTITRTKTQLSSNTMSYTGLPVKRWKHCFLY